MAQRYPIKLLLAWRNSWYERIIPLLQEYFYADSEAIKNILGEFIELKSKTKEEFGWSKLDRDLKPIYRIIKLEDTQFIEELNPKSYDHIWKLKNQHKFTYDVILC